MAAQSTIENPPRGLRKKDISSRVKEELPGWHAVGVVDNLDESLYARATLDKLLHLRRRLAHGLGDRERGLGHT